MFLRLLFCTVAVLLVGSVAQAQTDTVRIIHLSPKASIGNVLRVQVDDTTAFRINNGKLNYQKLSLMLNGVHFQTLHPEFISPNTLAFFLTYDSGTSKLWKLLLGKQRPSQLTIQVRISSAELKILTPPGSARSFTLLLYRQGWSTIAIFATAAVVVIFIVLMFTSNLIREPPPTDGTTVSSLPYSLARFQMALWFLVIFASFIYLVLLTGEWNGIINQTALILMGLGAAPVLGNNAIETSTTNASSGLFPSRGLLKDIISDTNGVRIHRIQQLVWTGTFIVMFIVSVIEDFSMPVFDTTNLLLMGISSSIYVALRPFER